MVSDPISLFPCLDCGDITLVRDRRDHGRLSQVHQAITGAHEGNRVVADALCEYFTEARRQADAEEKRVRSLAQQARRAQLKRMPFEVYRLTSERQTKRTQALSRAGYRCQVCGQRDARLDVHHNTYERFGDEGIYDLVVLCERCQGLFHGVLEDAS